MSENKPEESVDEPEVVGHTADTTEEDPGVCVGVYVYPSGQ